MSPIPFLIIGLGLFYSLLLFTAKDNVVRRARAVAIAEALSDAARAFGRSMDNLARASATAATTLAQLGKSMALARTIRPRIDRVIVADSESLYRLTRDIGARRAPAPSMFSSSLVGIPVVVNAEVEPGVAILMREGKQVGRIELSHFGGRDCE